MRVILEGLELDIFDFSLDFSGSKIPQFSFSVEARHFPNRNDLLLQPVSVYQNNSLLIAGIVAELPKPDIIDDNIGFLKLTCDNSLGYLYLELPALVQFQNVSITTALSTLLLTTDDTTWSLNDTSSLIDDDITIDVRDRETLWAQLEMIRTESPTPFYYRYAGFSGGTHLLDIGSFGEKLLATAQQHQNVIGSPRYSQPSLLPIKELRPVSGKVNGLTVNLSDALKIDATLASDPNYPLNASRQTIVNNTITSGRRLRKAYTGIKTDNSGIANQNEVNEVAVALYYRGRREMEASSPYETIRLDVVLDELPSIYAQMYVDVEAQSVHYDTLTGSIVKSVPIAVQGWYTINGIRLRGDDWVARQEQILNRAIPANVYQLELSNGMEIDDYNQTNYILEKTRSNSLNDNENIVSGNLGRTAVVVRQASVAANCDAGGGAGTGRLFTFPLPTIPSGATAVSTQIKSTSPSVSTVVITPATLSTSLQLCSTGAGGANWTVSDDVTITVIYTFS